MSAHIATSASANHHERTYRDQRFVTKSRKEIDGPKGHTVSFIGKKLKSGNEYNQDNQARCFKRQSIACKQEQSHRGEQ